MPNLPLGEEMGLRLMPGQWRPHYRWEQILWIRPPWDTQDYVWLDSPEAIFTDDGLLFLSHINQHIPMVHTDLDAVPWQEAEGGWSFQRELPNGFRFGGQVTPRDEASVRMELRFENGTGAAVTGFRLQTCLYLRPSREFAHPSHQTSFVHVPGRGWTPLPEAQQIEQGEGQYRLGGREGPAVADRPMTVRLSSRADRLVAMTWGPHTCSLWGNAEHPCIHADPCVPDLGPGQSAAVEGYIQFFEGTLAEFDAQMER